MAKICSNCGAELGDNAKFCINCGAKFDAEKIESAQPFAPPAAPAQYPAQVQNQNEYMPASGQYPAQPQNAYAPAPPLQPQPVWQPQQPEQPAQPFAPPAAPAQYPTQVQIQNEYMPASGQYPAQPQSAYAPAPPSQPQPVWQPQPPEQPAQPFAPPAAPAPYPPQVQSQNEYMPAPGQYPPQPQNAYAPQPAYVPQYAPYAPPAATPKKKNMTLFIIIGCIVAFIALAAAVVSIANNSGGNADAYKFGKDRVASIKAVVGKRKLTGSEAASSAGGVTTKRYTYKADSENGNQAADDISAYIAYLTENEGFLSLIEVQKSEVYAGGYKVQFAKHSVNEGMIIILDIDYAAEGYTLFFTKGEGTLTKKATPDEVVHAEEAASDPDPIEAGEGALTKDIFVIFDSGVYHLRYVMEQGGMKMNVDSYEKNGQYAMVIDTAGTKTRNVVKDGKSYTVMDAQKLVQVVDLTSDSEAPGVGDTAELTFISAGNREFKGIVYPFEEFSDESGGTVVFYVDGGELKGIRSVDGTGMATDMEVLAFDTNVPDSVFDIPKDYLMMEITGMGGDFVLVESYDIDGDSVPSVDSFVGFRSAELTGSGKDTDTDGEYLEYKYLSDTVIDDLNTYVTALQEQGWVVTVNEGTDKNGQVQLGIESVDSGIILLITIEYDESSYKVHILKTEGTLTRF